MGVCVGVGKSVCVCGCKCKHPSYREVCVPVPLCFVLLSSELCGRTALPAALQAINNFVQSVMCLGLGNKLYCELFSFIS